jgi:hypothetical protein
VRRAGLRIHSAGLLAAAVLLSAGPAAGQMLSHSCDERAPFGSGAVMASRYYPVRWYPIAGGEPSVPTSAISWAVPAELATAWLTNISIKFSEPKAAEAPRAETLRVHYDLKGTPSQPVWLVARMGGSAVRATVFLPAPYRFERMPPGPGAHYLGWVTLKGASFERAYALDKPLEVYLLSRDGTVLASRVDPLGERDGARGAVERLWREVVRRSADYQTLCVASEFIELEGITPRRRP